MEEECNNIHEQVKGRKIGVEEKVDTDKRDNILELLKKPWVQNGWRLENASENHKRDREIVISAINQIVFSIEFAPGDLWGDRDVVMTAVNQNGWALEFASEDLQGDKNIVMTAARNNGGALKFTSEDLRGNMEIVMTAVNQAGWALGFV